MSVPFGGLLLWNGESWDGDFLTLDRTRATICCIKFWCTCDKRSAREACIFAAFGPRPSDGWTARAAGSDCSLHKLSPFVRKSNA